MEITVGVNPVKNNNVEHKSTPMQWLRLIPSRTQSIPIEVDANAISNPRGPVNITTKAIIKAIIEKFRYL